jgi:hypothetical protein
VEYIEIFGKISLMYINYDITNNRNVKKSRNGESGNLLQLQIVYVHSTLYYVLRQYQYIANSNILYSKFLQKAI